MRLSRIVLLAAAWTAGLATQPAHADKEMLAGHWHLDFYGRCAMTAENVTACRYLLGPATFAAMDVPGAVIAVRGIGDYVSDRSGHFSVRFSTSISERVPHHGPAAACDNDTVFLGLVTGTCREVGTGHGHIARGITGMPDFWEDDSAGYWSGPPHARFASSSPTDAFNPACAGSYDTARFMWLFGIRHVPAGVVARVVLTHRP
jgi:hypothetical protein